MEHAIERLEFGALRTALLERVRTPLGALEAHAMAPFRRIADARERIEAIRQGRELLREQEPPPVEGAQDVRAALSLGEKGIVLEGQALRAIADTMRAGSSVRRQLLGYENKAPLLYGIAASLVDLSRVADEVSKSFDPDGQLADDASLELGPLRRRVRSLREMIREQIGGLLNAPEIQPYLQESYFTIRADRYVLPIKASFKNEVKGIVHDASGSGQTVFIEPSALVDLGNRLKIAQSEQTEEEQRILLRLTQRVVAEAQNIREMMRALGILDLVTACSRLADDLDCSPVLPSERPGFDLIQARHPLLLLGARAPRPALQAPTTSETDRGASSLPTSVKPREPSRPPPEVVANDLGLSTEQLVLVLTGPNTGGKTVAMKTVGLIALMARFGLHVPCDPRSTIGWFERIEVAIGDQQSIASHLSTFAAHLKLIVETLERADERTLVLIDEIAADTDPTQGQALAQAILEELAAHGAHTVVTTHFERLKAVPFSDRRFRNAGVGFDPLLLRPTYRVTLDMPQGSSGFEIARTLGLRGSIVDRAASLTGEGGHALERLMLELQTRSRELENAREQARSAAREAELERQKLIEAERKLEIEKHALLSGAREDLLKEIEETRAEVRRIIGALQSAAGDQSAREAMRMATEGAANLAKLRETEEGKRAGGESEQVSADLSRPTQVGDWIHVKQLAKDGEIVAIDEKEAQVVVGNMRMRVPLNALLPPRGRRPKKADRPEPGRLKRELMEVRSGRPPDAPKVTEEIDLRGHSIDESLDRLDAFLDHHYGTPTTHVRIVHGHGTGALRMAVRAHLKESGYVRSMRPGEEHEGGDGATIVELS